MSNRQRSGGSRNAPSADEYDESEMDDMEDPFGDFQVFKDKRSGLTGMGQEGENMGGFHMGSQRSGHGATGDPRGMPQIGGRQMPPQQPNYPPQMPTQMPPQMPPQMGGYNMPGQGGAYGGRPPAQHPGASYNVPPPMARPDVNMNRSQIPPGQPRPGMHSGGGYGYANPYPPQQPPQHHGWPGAQQHYPQQPKMPMGRGRPGSSQPPSGYIPKSEYNTGYGQPMRY
jgi:hypothetical protein